MSKESRRKGSLSKLNKSPASFSRMTNNMKSNKKNSTLITLNKQRSEQNTISARSASPYQFEKELLRSLKVMRRENFEAKRELKAIYDYKLEKLRENMLIERRENEKTIKSNLKFQKHATNVHKKRADTYKNTADELIVIADNQRRQNEEILEVMANRR